MSTPPDRPPRRRVRSAAGAVALVLAGVSAAIWLGGCDSEPEVAERQPPEVTVARPEVETVTEFLRFEGRFEAVETVRIRARVPGFLERVAFEESSRVTAGDLLFVIEPEPYRVAVQRAESELRRRQAEANAARVRRDLVREAFEQGAATELEMVQAEAELAVDEAGIEQARAALEDARLRLSYTEVRSPIDGTIDRNYVDVGNLVGEGERTLLATVISSGEIHVVFEASERTVLQYIARGQTGRVGEPGVAAPVVEVGRLVDEGHPFRGRVDYIDTVVDRATGTLTVRATVPDPEDVLVPGLFARIRTPFEEIEDAVLVEEDAIGTAIDGRYVYVVGPDDVVERRKVEVGGRYGTRRLIRSGLEPEERYVVVGLQRARPGLPVRPTERSRASGDAAGGGGAGGSPGGGDAPGGTGGSRDSRPEDPPGEDGADDGAEDGPAHGAGDGPDDGAGGVEADSAAGDAEGHGVDPDPGDRPAQGDPPTTRDGDG